MNWTKEQQKVIETRGGNILVSASAGSGKTAVLVARILSFLTDAEHPADIDELLIVTFTRAAASEMKERIGRAIADALKKNPGNEHLLRQTSLIHTAQITTIDGFCSMVVRNYCHLTALAAGFRVAEEGETKLMKSDVLQEVLEEYYSSEDPDIRARFPAFVETFATGKSEKMMEDVILKVSAAAESQPWPSDWLAGCRSAAGRDSFSELAGEAWMQEFLRDADDVSSEGLAYAKENLTLVNRPDGPEAYRPTAEQDVSFFTEFCDERDYGKRYELLNHFQQLRLSGKKAGKDENPDLRTVFKENRAEIDAVREELQKSFYTGPEEQALQFLKENEVPVDMLISVTETFLSRYAEKKREKNLVDFSDLEHYALEILRGKTSTHGRTQAARELSGRYREVLIDEYQDSNYLQEAILTAVSRMEEGENNYFCVGDVKQSIYAFRHARPDLFMEKFYSYGRDPAGAGIRIDLQKNFRSRREVLDTVNGLFSQLMQEQAGGVEYDPQAFLIPGADDPYEDGKEDAYRTEFLTVFTGEETDDGAHVLSDTSVRGQRELEAGAIASRIRTMVDTEKIWDEKKEEFRPVRYHDIAVLLRTMEGWADVFAEVFESRGIPAYSTAKSGYFSAPEVVTVLNYLAIIDNPEQDIPFTSVLKSAIGGLSAEDLAVVRAEGGTSGVPNKDASMAACARNYALNGSGRALKERLRSFFEYYDEVRGSVSYTPIHELIWAVVTHTGYMDYISALPGGRQRAANIRMLIEKAIAYEGTSYVGLFNFIRYIGNLRKYDVDFGEVNVIGENEDTVRIVSIHKSKGLEYPVVFAAGMGKAFNRQDLRASVLIHPKYGISSDYVDYVRRTRAPTIKYLASARRLLRDNSGEELRVLYVALTRAKQKLILSGTIKNEEKLEKMYLTLPLSVRKIPVNYILHAKTPWDILIPAAERMEKRALRDGEEIPFTYVKVNPSGLIREETGNLLQGKEILRELSEMPAGKIYDPEMHELLEKRFSFSYPHARVNLPVKVSVSELKHAHMEDEEAFELRERADSAAGRICGEAGGKGAGPEGAQRGTAYHKVMELLDFRALFPDGRRETPPEGRKLQEEIRQQMDGFVLDGRLTEEEAGLTEAADIAGFISEPVAGRMAEAMKSGQLYREKPFVFGISAKELNPDWPEDENILVQGIIDAFFYEGQDLILLDYKTDHVRSEEELIRRYKIQLDAYAAALSRVTAARIREKLIWSFHLKKLIRLE